MGADWENCVGNGRHSFLRLPYPSVTTKNNGMLCIFLLLTLNQYLTTEWVTLKGKT